MAQGVGGSVFYGPDGISRFGERVREIGDVNGDGRVDFAFVTTDAGNGYGAPTDPNLDQVGHVYVFYGQDGDFDPEYDLTFGTGVQPDGALFSVIEGDLGFSKLGQMINPAGDVNGDGLADLIFGSDRYDDSDGGAFVIYGQQGGLGPVLRLGDLTASQGSRLSDSASTQFGIAGGGLGDINGDGHDDLIVMGEVSKSAHVIFGTGTALPGAIDIAAPPAGLQVLTYTDVNARGGSIGDINGDGLGDFAISARSNADGLAVILGSTALGAGTQALPDVTLDGDTGFRVLTGGIWDVAPTGDINGDGLRDFVVAGQSDGYLIFGSDTGFDAVLDPATFDGSTGVRLTGAGVTFNFGGAGDMNGDGIEDLVIGNRNANSLAGETYILFGSRDGFGGAVDLTALDGSDGYRLQARQSFDQMDGGRLADVNGDGFADLLTGAWRYDRQEGTQTFFDVGAGFVVYGGPERMAALDAADGTPDGVLSLGALDTVLDFTEPDPVPVGLRFAIEGTPDADRLEGTIGDDEILGFAGDDVLLGLAGNDTLDGGTGRDTMEGGAGDDTYRVDDRNDRIVDIQGGGSDTVLATGEVTLGSAEVERVVLEGSRGLRVNGNGFDTEIVGNSGSNILIGGGGDDTVTGGGGQDFFAFLTSDADGTTRITDFGGADQLALDDRFFGLGDGSIDVRAVTQAQINNAVRSGAVEYNFRTGEMWIDGDGRGGPGAPQLIAIIEGGGAIGVDDVLLF